MTQQIRGQCGHFVFLIGPKKTQMWYRTLWSCFLSSFVEFCSAVKRRSRKCLSQSEVRAVMLFFFDRPEKHILGIGHWDIAFCQVSLNSVQRFQRRRRQCLSQSAARAAILFFRSARKHKLWWKRWDLDSCKVSLISFQSFQRISRKCESLFWTDGRLTTRYDNSLLDPSAQVS